MREYDGRKQKENIKKQGKGKGEIEEREGEK